MLYKSVNYSSCPHDVARSDRINQEHKLLMKWAVLNGIF